MRSIEIYSFNYQLLYILKFFFIKKTNTIRNRLEEFRFSFMKKSIIRVSDIWTEINWIAYYVIMKATIDKHNAAIYSLYLI